MGHIRIYSAMGNIQSDWLRMPNFLIWTQTFATSPGRSGLALGMPFPSPLPTNASACHSICCTLLRQTGFPITKAVSRKTPKSAVSLPLHLHSDSRLMHIGHSQGSSRKHAGCLLSTTCIILWSGILLLSLRRHGNSTWVPSGETTLARCSRRPRLMPTSTWFRTK